MGIPERNWPVLWIGLLTGLVVLVGVLLRFLDRGAETRAAPNVEIQSTAQQTVASEGPLPAAAPDEKPDVAERSQVLPTKVKEPPAKRTVGRSSVRGQVVDDLGRVLAGIRVEAAPGDLPDPGMIRYVLPDGTTAPKLKSREISATSDFDGAFVLEGLKRGRWHLTALGEGDLRSAPVFVDLPSEEAPSTLVLPRGAVVGGIVVDTSGRRLAEAEVHLLYGDDYAYHGLESDRGRRVHADSAGGFLIESVLPGTVHLMASDERHPETEWISVDVAPGEKHDDVRLEISAGGRIEGTIHPAAGEVAHRKINLYSLRGSIGWRETETDEAGRFVIDGVIPQDYIIELRKVIEEGGGTTEREEIRKKIEVKDGETTEVVFGAPTRSIRVRGMITSRGLPLSGIEVQPYSADGNEDVGTKVTTGLDGRYEMSVPGAGEYWFSVSANEDSYVGFTRKVPEEEAVELSFDVPGGVIAGRVLDPSGKPVGRAPISVTRTGSGDRRNFYRDDYRSMPSASDGTFEFRLLAPGTYTLRTPDGCKNYAPMHVPFGRAVLTDLLVDEQTQLTSIEVRLPAEGRITGTVVDAQGAPVTEAWICVKDVRGISLSGDWETQTDATGHFEVWSVAPGTCTVRVRTQELDVTSAPITVEAGKAASTRIELR